MLVGSVGSVVSSESHHVEVLRRGPRTWNFWRAQNPHITPNLIGITLSVAERQVGPINGGPINLAEARLRHASLRFATLTNADLTGADLSDTDLREARLIGANLSGANLSVALVDQADFAGACLAGANLSGTSLLEVRNITQGQIDEAAGDLLTLLPPHLSRPRALDRNRLPCRGRSAIAPGPRGHCQQRPGAAGGQRAGQRREDVVAGRGSTLCRSAQSPAQADRRGLGERLDFSVIGQRKSDSGCAPIGHFASALLSLSATEF